MAGKSEPSDFDDTLLITFETRIPIGADEIAGLLGALSSDYKRLTGGQLVLWQYQTGSAWIFLRDAISMAGGLAGSVNNVVLAVQNLRRFATTLRDGIVAEQVALPPSDVGTVARSLERIAKIAAKSNGTVSMRYMKNEKDGVEEVNFFMNNQRARNFVPYREDKPQARQVTNDTVNIDEAVRQLKAVDGTPSEVVGILIAAMRATGGEYLFPSLVDALTAAGRPDLAREVQVQIRGAVQS